MPHQPAHIDTATTGYSLNPGRVPAAALALTQDEVRRLLEDTTSGTRVDLTDKIASAYGNNEFNEREVLIAEQIFRLLVRDTEVRVRSTLARHIKESNHIPRDIIMTLARDVTEVSLPVLQYSDILSDEDLLDLISNTHEISRYLAISQRKQVSGIVSDALIDRGNEEVASLLVKNDGADLSDTGLDKIIKHYGNNEALMQTVGNRPHLPISAVEKLISVVSSSLASSLKNKYKLPGEQVEKEVEKTREGETLVLIRHAYSQEDIDKLVGQLISFDRLSPSLILSALCQGNFAFFETCLARLSTIPVANARTLITDRGELGFRAIYNKSGLPDAMFPAVKLLLKVVRELDGGVEKPGSSRYANRVVERILQYSETDPVENLSYIIALVRRIAQ